MVPVHQRIVEADAHALGAGGIDVLLDEVAAGALFGRAVIGEFGIEVAEALVVLGGHHHVFLAGSLGQFGPIASGVRPGLEAFGELFVLGDGNAFVLHDPLVASQDAVQAPVDEHAETGFVPPFHAGLAVGVARGGGKGGCRGGGAGGHEFQIIASRHRDRGCS